MANYNFVPSFSANGIWVVDCYSTTSKGLYYSVTWEPN